MTGLSMAVLSTDPHSLVQAMIMPACGNDLDAVGTNVGVVCHGSIEGDIYEPNL
jgi:hypothetical protein